MSAAEAVVGSADDEGVSGLFPEEPPSVCEEQEAPRTADFERAERRSHHDGQPPRLTLRLARKHSLWAHELWNAARFLASLIDSGALDMRGKCVLELGAGAGLPSLLAALNGAVAVISTDYGTASDTSLLEALSANATSLNATRAASPGSALWSCDVTALPFVWGKSAELLREALPPGRETFDVIVCCDLLFARAAHAALLSSIDALMAPDGVAVVAFSHHDPEKSALDMAFFDLARAPPFRFRVLHCAGQQFARDLFIEGDGLDEARAMVHHYELRRA